MNNLKENSKITLAVDQDKAKELIGKAKQAERLVEELIESRSRTEQLEKDLAELLDAIKQIDWLFKA